MMTEKRPFFATVRKYSYSTTRKAGTIVLRLILLVLVGTVGGALLGNMIAGQRLSSGLTAPAAYPRLSANPDAAATQAITDDGCIGCLDSYGVAAPLRAERQGRMNDAFWALGPVDPEAMIDESDDGYRYGGRFPDSELRPLTIDAAPENLPSQGMVPPSGEAP